MIDISILWQWEVVTLNQQVTGSIPVRLTFKQSQNLPTLSPLITKLVNNGLPFLLTSF